MLGRPVKPGQCALLLAIPLTEAGFKADLANTNKDLAKSIKSLKIYEENVIQPLNVILPEIQSAGITVVCNTTIEDFGQIIRSFPVVTLFAHWKYLPMSEQDIISLEKFHGRLRDAKDNPREASAVQSKLLRNPQIRGSRTKAQLAEALNRELKPASDHNKWEMRITEPPKIPQPSGGINRVQIEECFPDCIARGLSLELCDGLHCAQEVIDAIPPNTDAMIDLQVCYGEVLGEAVKRQRPLCNIIFPTGRATIDVRFVLYKYTVLLLNQRPQPYEDAMKQVHESLLSEIQRRQDISENLKGSNLND